MTYIIQNVFGKPNEQNETCFNSVMARKGRMKFNRIVRILYNDRDFSDQLKQLLLPSQRNEHRKPITVIRL